MHTVHCVVLFTINIGIVTCFVHCKYINHNKENVSVYDYIYQRKIIIIIIIIIVQNGSNKTNRY